MSEPQVVEVARRGPIERRRLPSRLPLAGGTDMRMGEFVVTAVAAGAIGWVGHSAWSDDPPSDPMTAAFEALAKPGEQHARLKTLAGEWTTHGVFNMGPTPTEFDGTSSMTMILGDRYLRQEMKSTFMGSPYEGWG